MRQAKKRLRRGIWENGVEKYSTRRKIKSAPSATLLPLSLVRSTNRFLRELAPLIRRYVFKLHRVENPQCVQRGVVGRVSVCVHIHTTKRYQTCDGWYLDGWHLGAQVDCKSNVCVCVCESIGGNSSDISHFCCRKPENGNDRQM